MNPARVFPKFFYGRRWLGFETPTTSIAASSALQLLSGSKAGLLRSFWQSAQTGPIGAPNAHFDRHKI